MKAYLEAVLHANGISAGVGPLEGITDRSAHPDRRALALERYRQLVAQGDDAQIAEVEPDVEAARLLTIRLYLAAYAEAPVTAGGTPAPPVTLEATPA